MKRSQFLASLAGGAFAVPALADDGPFISTDVVVERAQPGKPHAGKVLAAIQPHADDLPLFAGGLILKLLEEGYTGYLIRTTNDDHTGPGTAGEGVLANERDNAAVAKAFGLKKVYDLGYRNHMLDAVSPSSSACASSFFSACCRWTPSSVTTPGATTRRIRTTTSRPAPSRPPAGCPVLPRTTRSISTPA